MVLTESERKVLAEWSVLGEDPWSRFSRSVDYRKVESTKPHQSHPNFVFEMDGDVWVTRLRQRDAISLERPGKRIDIAVQSPHDGFVCGHHIYFTTVDGRVAIANRRNLQIDKIVDLKEIGEEKALLGWCRGLLPVDERRIWIGFTRVRKTRFKENVLWVANILREGVIQKPTHIALYDLTSRQCLQEVDLESHGMNIVFSIFAASP